MAITKYKVIKKNLEAVIKYAKDGDKTENGILSTKIEMSDIDFAKWNRSVYEYAKKSSN